jgi:hypothetical protein
MTHDPTRDCEHGRLKGKCDVCDLQAEVEGLNRVNAELVEALKELSLYVAHNGDTWVQDKARADLAKATGETK